MSVAFRIIVLSTCMVALFAPNVIGQEDILQEAKSAKDKVKSLKDSLLSNRMTLSGQVQGRLGYNYINNRKGPFDAQLNASVVLSYKGLQIPANYTYSRGRSILQLDGPSIRTPSFKALGISPTYKDWTLHIGNRTMRFSKYTYENMRFDGVGLESPEKGVYTKVLKGRLRNLSPTDQLFTTSAELFYRRDALGVLAGYSSEKLGIKAIVFDAKDQFDEWSVTDSSQIKPKENVVISYHFQYMIADKLTVTWTQAQSALTSDASSSRIDIPSHQSLKNIFGLFTKKESSQYFQARNLELSYQTGLGAIGLQHEHKDRGYVSLGSQDFDQNFNDYKLNLSGQFLKKINWQSSIGLRENDERLNQDDEQFMVITYTNANWLVNDNLSIGLGLSNLRQTQKNFLQTVNSTAVDSLFLSQNNFSVNTNGTYSISKNDLSKVWSAFYSYSKSNSIRDIEVTSQTVSTHNVNINYSINNEKHQSSVNLSYAHNKFQDTRNQIIGLSGTQTRPITDVFKLSSNLYYGLNINQTQTIHQINFTSRLNAQINKSFNASFDVTSILDNSQSNFNLNGVQFNLNLNYSLTPITIMQ